MYSICTSWHIPTASFGCYYSPDISPAICMMGTSSTPVTLPHYWIGKDSICSLLVLPQHDGPGFYRASVLFIMKSQTNCWWPQLHQIPQRQNQYGEYHHLLQELCLNDSRFSSFDYFPQLMKCQNNNNQQQKTNKKNIFFT